MNIPPSIGVLLSLIVGIGIGAYGMNARHESAQFKADREQVADDNELGAEISTETAALIESSPVTKIVIKYKDKIIKVPQEFTDEEIDTLCVNQYMPSDILQLVRNQIARARQRIDNVRDQ